jgi:RES domain-containing protein
MIEYFIHIGAYDPPNDLVLVTADVPDSVSRISITSKRLPTEWQQTPAPPELAIIGDSFVQVRRAAVLMVPSALAPFEFNWLISPEHSEFRKVRLRPSEPFHYDSRFFS